MVTALFRLLLQLGVHRRLYLDDWLLILAISSLSASTAIGYLKVGVLYWEQELNYNETRCVELLAMHVNNGAGITSSGQLAYIYSTFLWISTFAVKFAYLAFFRRLVERIKPLMCYCRIIIAITMMAFTVCIISLCVPCTKCKREARKSTNMPNLKMLILGISELR